MVIVDTALEKRARQGNPVRIGLIGAGYMGRGTAHHILSAYDGLRLVAVSNRTMGEAERAYRQGGIESVRHVDTVSQLENAISSGEYAITEDAMLLCEAGGIDAIVEATGEVEFGARVALRAIEHGKHVILMNAELDATVGPLLKVYADKAGVVITNIDGDQPGSIMNLLRFVKTIGYKPVLAGNIKGMIDHYRTPATQKPFADANKQKPRMITSFADGTKISMEMTVVANATGFRVGKRGMYGPQCAHASEAVNLFSKDELLNGGLVDYVLGAEPGPGVFVMGYCEDNIKQQYMNYFKMGDGPFYVFYTPYHLPHVETPITIARAVLFQDATAAPLAGPVCDVITLAKRDLQAGESLDGIGGFTCYGTIDNSRVCQSENLLPMGLSEGCILTRDISKDQTITYADVELPANRLCDELRRKQDAHFADRLFTVGG